MPLDEAVDILRTWAMNPGTNLGAEMQGLLHPMSLDNGYAVRRLIASWGGDYWPEKPTPHTTSGESWIDRYKRINGKDN